MPDMHKLMPNLARHEVVWDGSDAAGRQMPASVYFYRIDAGGWSETRRMMLVK